MQRPAVREVLCVGVGGASGSSQHHTILWLSASLGVARSRLSAWLCFAGKLRLLYECAPMSFIMEQAGGKGSTGRQRVMDICPERVHQRVPLFIGSPKEIDYVESFLN